MKTPLNIDSKNSKFIIITNLSDPTAWMCKLLEKLDIFARMDHINSSFLAILYIISATDWCVYDGWLYGKRLNSRTINHHTLYFFFEHQKILIPSFLVWPRAANVLIRPIMGCPVPMLFGYRNSFHYAFFCVRGSIQITEEMDKQKHLALAHSIHVKRIKQISVILARKVIFIIDRLKEN